jgi:uncharacterized glyoxalase superfamily protein PhnB
MIKTMKLNAVSVSANNINKSVEFYKILGFKFPEFAPEDRHVESVIKEGETKLMIDSVDMVKEILGYEPKPSNHSSFAIEYDAPEELNLVAGNLEKSNYKIVKEPWDAFWGQRYAIVEDPDGYLVDLYARLK